MIKCKKENEEWIYKLSDMAWIRGCMMNIVVVWGRLVEAGAAFPWHFWRVHLGYDRCLTQGSWCRHVVVGKRFVHDRRKLLWSGYSSEALHDCYCCSCDSSMLWGVWCRLSKVLHQRELRVGVALWWLTFPSLLFSLSATGFFCHIQWCRYRGLLLFLIVSWVRPGLKTRFSKKLCLI